MIVFYHIPKCAGTYVTEFFCQQFNYVNILPDPDNSLSPVPHIGLSVKEGYPVEYMSYHGVRCPKKISNEDFWFTFMRNPIDIFVSHFYYTRQVSTKHRNYNSTLESRKDLELIMKIDIDSFIDFFYESEEDFYPKKVYTEIDFSCFDFIGFHETFETDFSTLLSKLNLAVPISSEKINVTNFDKKYPSESSLKKMKEILQDDIKIYEKLKNDKQENSLEIGRV